MEILMIKKLDLNSLYIIGFYVKKLTYGLHILEVIQKNITQKEKELILSNILIKRLQEDLKINKGKLSETEKNILIEKLALKNLRKKLYESREE